MNEAFLRDGAFRHVSTQGLVDPFIALFYSVTRVGHENSVVLRDQTQGGPSAALAAFDPGRRTLHDFSTDCRGAVTFAQQSMTGRVTTLSSALIALAEQAAQQCALRKNEDAQAWAEQLARDVGNATD